MDEQIDDKLSVGDKVMDDLSDKISTIVGITHKNGIVDSSKTTYADAVTITITIDGDKSGQLHLRFAWEVTKIPTINKESLDGIRNN